MAKKILTLQETPYRVLKPIVYKNPAHELYRQEVQRGQVLTFPHLPDEDIQLLLKIRVIGPADDAAMAAYEAEQEAQQAAEMAAIKAAEDGAIEADKVQARMKTAANKKQSAEQARVEE